MVVENILMVFESYRMNPLATDQYDLVGKDILRQKITSFVLKNEPIKFSIMGFPMKSTNTRDKVLGVVPDLAEQLTMDNFREFNNSIKLVYPPGIHITIASDGFAFSDVLGVEEKIVDAYQEISTSMIKEAPVSIVNIRDFYDNNSSISTLQDKMIQQHGISSEELQRRILFEDDVNILYRGMLRFMEEELSPKNHVSKNQLHKEAKILTKEMMLRNEAYSGLVRSNLSDHIRLSMHPSINNGVKYSFQLIRSPKALRSAWHCAIMFDTKGIIHTVHKKEAEALGAELIYNNNTPWAYQAVS